MTVHGIAQFLRVLTLIAGILMLIDSLGVKITSLLALGGIGGLAVSFAAKDTLANFLGGMMIYWDRPFSVGDWIRSPDREIEGTVEHIGWRLTRIRTFDTRPLYVPNGVFSSISIENPARMTHRRIKNTVSLRYDDANTAAKITVDIKEMLVDHPALDNSQTTFVNVSEFAPSSLNLLVQAFTKTTDTTKFQAVQEDVFLKIIDIIRKHGAECAFPTTTLHVPDGMLIKQNPGEMA